MRIAPLLFLLQTTLAVIGCSMAAEQSILSQFFAASRLRDTTALKNIATVVFEPGAQGIVTSFEITNIEPYRTDGELVSENVSISAPVKLPNGGTVQKDLVITMQRYTGQWIVTAIADAPSRPGSPSTPRP
jgi:hypothetical protein